MYKVYGYFYAASGNCEKYYLNGFKINGLPKVVGIDCAKIYKTLNSAKKAIEKWKEWIIGNGCCISDCKFNVQKIG